MGGSSASHNNPDKVRAGNRKTKIQIVWIMCRPVIENARGVWLLNNNRSFLIYKNLKKIYAYSNNYYALAAPRYTRVGYRRVYGEI